MPTTCWIFRTFALVVYARKALGGSTAIAGARPEISAVPRGIKVLRRVNKVPPPFYLRMRPALAGVMLDRWFDDDVVPPGTVRMHSGGRPTEGGVQAADALAAANGLKVVATGRDNPTDHNGVDARSQVMVRIEGGTWQLLTQT